MDLAMDTSETQVLLKGVAKTFKAGLQSKTWDIHGMPHFVTTMHHEGCDMGEAYTLHVVEASRAPMERYHLGRLKRPSKSHGQTLFTNLRMKCPQNQTKKWSGTVTAMTI